MKDGKWQFDRHIPVVVILALLLQTAGVVWWAATISARVDVLEQWVRDNKSIETRLSRIEVQLSGIISRMDRQERRER